MQLASGLSPGRIRHEKTKTKKRKSSSRPQTQLCLFCTSPRSSRNARTKVPRLISTSKMESKTLLAAGGWEKPLSRAAPTHCLGALSNARPKTTF